MFAGGSFFAGAAMGDGGPRTFRRPCKTRMWPLILMIR
jgi:hypothetical protein